MMKISRLKRGVIMGGIVLGFVISGIVEAQAADIPHLRKQGTATQLIVDGKPFLILAGELGNSTVSSIEYMKPIWPRLAQANLNTVLAPVYWDLIEPQEGRFDWTLVDGLLRGAKSHDLRLVLLWFGSWKNSMSCYAPYWVKTDIERFPRAQDAKGSGLEIMSAFSDENLNADKRAFAALMRHIRKVDGRHTVIMVQVENEPGMIPDARDHHASANEKYEEIVPKELMDYLVEHKETLIPEFNEIWSAAGFKTSGTFEEIFGKGLATEEIFMAWHYARYIGQVAAAGKAEYPLPMFVNAALIRPGYKPGQYPSAGPLPHLLDVWRAGAPQIDFLAPDVYFPNFVEWVEKYDRSGNPLFIPEAGRGAENPANAFYAIGQHNALGFSPFAIESIPCLAVAGTATGCEIAQAYDVLQQLAPMILENQGKGTIAGVLVDANNPNQQVILGDYKLNVKLDAGWGQPIPPGMVAGCIIISMSPDETAETRSEAKSPLRKKLKKNSADSAVSAVKIVSQDEYLIAGKGLVITFEPNTPGAPLAGIGSIQQGTFVNGRWKTQLWLNGDQSHQGRHLRLPAENFEIQRIKLYRYR